jgi:ABC-type dipeptide/oligopeptide/nickel transport system permease subunit
VEFQQDPAPIDGHDGKSLSLALRGALFGCVGIGVVSGVMGVWPLFFAFPQFTVHLVVSALLGAALTTMLTRHCKRPLSDETIMATAAVLTLVLFAVLPLYLFFHRSSWAARLLFG